MHVTGEDADGNARCRARSGALHRTVRTEAPFQEKERAVAIFVNGRGEGVHELRSALHPLAERVHLLGVRFHTRMDARAGQDVRAALPERLPVVLRARLLPDMRSRSLPDGARDLLPAQAALH